METLCLKKEPSFPPQESEQGWGVGGEGKEFVSPEGLDFS